MARVDLSALVAKAFASLDKATAGVVIAGTYRAVAYAPNVSTGAGGETTTASASFSAVRTQRTAKVLELLGEVGGQLQPTDELWLVASLPLVSAGIAPSVHDKVEAAGVAYTVLGVVQDPAGATYTLALRRRP